MSNQPAPPVSPNDTPGQTGGTDLLQEDDDAMAQHTRAHRSDGDTAPTAMPAGPGAPTAPDHDTAGDPSEPGRRRDRVPLIAGVVLGLVLIGLFLTVWAINRPQQDQTPQPAPAPVATSSASAANTTPAVAPSAAAYAAAENTYRAWETNFAAAILNYQPQKLDATLVTPAALSQAQAQIARLGKGSTDTAHYTQDIKSAPGVDYTLSSLTLRVCAVTVFQFIDPTGKDITVNRDGTPATPNTTARTNDVKMTSSDSGKTWQIASLTTELDAEAGQPC